MDASVAIATLFQWWDMDGCHVEAQGERENDIEDCKKFDEEILE